MATTQAKSESVAKSNAALARLMATLPAPTKPPVTTETKTKAELKAARLAEQDKVLAANAQKVVAAPQKAARKNTKAAVLAKQGDTAKGERKAIVATKAATRATLPAGDPLGMEAGLKAIAKMDVSKAVKKAVAQRATKAVEAVKAKAAAAPVVTKKPNVKVAILDLFYANLDLQLSTMETVLTLQHLHGGMNESSIRVWLTDLRKDGTLVKVETRDGKDILTAGTPGEQWGLRGTTSTFALAHKGKPLRVPPAAPVKASAVLPPSLQIAIVNATKSFEKMMAEFNRFTGKQS